MQSVVVAGPRRLDSKWLSSADRVDEIEGSCRIQSASVDRNERQMNSFNLASIFALDAKIEK
jgi:hypothetical protein